MQNRHFCQSPKPSPPQAPTRGLRRLQLELLLPGKLTLPLKAALKPGLCAYAVRACSVASQGQERLTRLEARRWRVSSSRAPASAHPSTTPPKMGGREGKTHTHTHTRARG